MIQYRERITLSRSQSGLWHMMSDRGDRYEMKPANQTRQTWTDWWITQSQTEARRWQKDIMREFALRYFEDLHPWLVWKPGVSYSAAHDVVVCHSEAESTWLISTQRDFWIVRTEYGEFTVRHGEASLGDVTQQQVRLERVAPVLDAKLFR